MQINAIKTDAAGFKLIAASRLQYNRKHKPGVMPSKFFDYKDGVLTAFCSGGFITYPAVNFKAALRLIQSM